jgi:hypothetical protein
MNRSLNFKIKFLNCLRIKTHRGFLYYVVSKERSLYDVTADPDTKQWVKKEGIQSVFTVHLNYIFGTT